MGVRIYINGKRRRRPRLLWMKLGPVTEQRLSGPSQVSAMMFEMTDSQQVKVTVAAVDKKGKAARVADPVWSSTDDTVAVVTQDSTDPLSALVVAGNPGVAQVKCTADADLGDGVRNVEATLDLSITGGAAVGFTITPGPVEEQP